MGEYVLSSEMMSWSTSISTKWICQNCISQLETRSVCRVALAMRVKDKELNDFGNTWTIPHCFLIMSHWKNDFQISLWSLPCDVQGVSTSWRVRLCYLAENLQSVSWCSHHHVGIAPISMGILSTNDWFWPSAVLETGGCFKLIGSQNMDDQFCGCGVPILA